MLFRTPAANKEKENYDRASSIQPISCSHKNRSKESSPNFEQSHSPSSAGTCCCLCCFRCDNSLAVLKYGISSLMLIRRPSNRQPNSPIGEPVSWSDW